MTYSVSTSSSAETQQLAARLARLLKGGEIIELASDLGGGKTTFTQGLASGLGYEGKVTSPTFTLSQVYRLKPGLELHHYDLYRLAESGVVGDELAEDLDDPYVITVIEWADIAQADLPADRLTIRFEPTGEDSRAITCSAGGPKAAAILQQLMDKPS